MNALCFHGDREVDTEHAPYVIAGTPCRGGNCLEVCWASQPPSPEKVIMVTVRRREPSLEAVP
jgi:hypothetical protein